MQLSIYPKEPRPSLPPVATTYRHAAHAPQGPGQLVVQSRRQSNATLSPKVEDPASGIEPCDGHEATLLERSDGEFRESSEV